MLVVQWKFSKGCKVYFLGISDLKQFVTSLSCSFRCIGKYLPVWPIYASSNLNKDSVENITLNFWDIPLFLVYSYFKIFSHCLRKEFLVSYRCFQQVIIRYNIFISLDFKSLFTKISTSLATEVVRSRWDQINQHTWMNLESFTLLRQFLQVE